MPFPSDRVVRRVVRNFGAAVERVLQELAEVPETFPGCEPQDAERLHAALIVGANGNLARFAEYLEIGRADCRDLLVWTGFGSEDWPARLDRELGAE